MLLQCDALLLLLLEAAQTLLLLVTTNRLLEQLASLLLLGLALKIALAALLFLLLELALGLLALTLLLQRLPLPLLLLLGQLGLECFGFGALGLEISLQPTLLLLLVCAQLLLKLSPRLCLTLLLNLQLLQSALLLKGGGGQ